MAVQKSASFARQVRLLRSGPERIIFDLRNGVIPQLLRIDARALGGFDNPLGERGSNQRSHGRVSLIPQLGPSVIKRLRESACSALLVSARRDRIGMHMNRIGGALLSPTLKWSLSLI